MNETIKNRIGNVGMVGILAVAIAALMYSFAYQDSVDPYTSFSVSGEGRVTAIPDIAEVSATVLTEGGTDLAALQKKNSDKGNAVVAFVKEKGVEDKDVKTQNYTIEPRYQYTPCSYEYGKVCPPAEIVGYSIRQTISVKVRNFDAIGDILKGVVDRGANTVSGPSFTIDDPKETQAEARIEAMTDARTKAEAIAKAAGFKLGKIQYISEGGGPTPYGYESAMGMGGDMVKTFEAAPPTVEPGSQEVVVQVNIQYEIK
ncbi:MAG: SIMPL domain-containing protein [Patescibacteria group bacterium]